MSPKRLALSEYPKTLLVNVPDYDDYRPQEPLGLYYLTAFLRESGFCIEALDANAHYKKLTYEQIVKCITKNGYDVVGLPAFTPIFFTSTDIAKKIKKANPKVKIIFGGHHATFTHREILEKFSFVDIIVRGEGELTLLEVLERLKNNEDLMGVKAISYRNDGKIIANPARPLIEDIDTLPFPIRDNRYFMMQPPQNRGASVVASRGCPYHCSFCSVGAFYRSQPGKIYRMRSALNVVNEIIILINNFSVKHIFFADDNIFIKPNLLMEITERLSLKNIFPTFTIATRSDQIIQHKKYIPMLKKRGLQAVELGIESASQAVLNRFCKGVTIGENKEAIEILRKNDIRVKIDFIMFDPKTSINELKENVNFIRDLGIIPFFYRGFVKDALCKRIDLYPGTPYYERMKKEGKLKGDAFCPGYEFEDKKVAKVYDFITILSEELDGKLKDVYNSINQLMLRLGKLSPSKKKKKPSFFIIDLMLAKFKLDKLQLKILERILEVGEKVGFNRKLLKKVKKEIEDGFGLLKDEIYEKIKHIRRLNKIWQNPVKPKEKNIFSIPF